MPVRLPLEHLPMCVHLHNLLFFNPCILAGLDVVVIYDLPCLEKSSATQLLSVVPMPIPWKSGKTTSLCSFHVFFFFGCAKGNEALKAANSPLHVQTKHFAALLKL
jgi:hypothetical protein